MVMMWMEFECETSLLAKTPETCQHFFDFFQNCHLFVTFLVVAKLSNGGLQRKCGNDFGILKAILARMTRDGFATVKR
jgi:hypothetical protein